MFKSQIKDKLFKVLDSIEIGELKLTLPDGDSKNFGGKTSGVVANLKINDYKAIRVSLSKGDIGLAEAYQKAWFDSDNLENLLTLFLANAKWFEPYLHGNFLTKLLAQFFYFFRTNTIKGSQKNIHSHYDLGNHFYSLWLDETMTYSSAIFKQVGDTLTEAQHHKYDRIIEQLENQSGSLLEIGCGWGGFAERALSQADYQIKGITISDEQHQFASQRLKNQSFNQAQIMKEDYRLQQGSYDCLVSIEMFEAVGEKYWPVYFNKVKSLLAKKGKALIQTIHIDDAYFENYRKTGDMIRTYIFPGGMLPSRSRFEYEAQKAGLKITDEFNFGQDYAQTLKLWLARFEQVISEVKELNFDDPFIRLWQFYLAFCIVGFKQKRTNVSQFRLEHA